MTMKYKKATYAFSIKRYLISLLYLLLTISIPKRLEDAGISKTINDDILGRRLMI